MTEDNSLIAAIRGLDLPELRRAWILEGDWLICGDVHIPFTDWVWAHRVTLIGRTMRRPRKLLIAGDLLNMDSFSAYQHIVDPPSWAQEKAAAKATLAEWLGVFQEIKILSGNHERRLIKFTAAAFDETDWLGLIADNERVQSSARGWCIINAPSGYWRVTHPKNYSINQLTVADQLAQKYHCHIISAHEHHLGLGLDRYGAHVIVNCGGLVDPAKLAYVSMDDSKSAAMKNGFVTLIGGIPKIYGDWPLTDWGHYDR